MGLRSSRRKSSEKWPVFKHFYPDFLALWVGPHPVNGQEFLLDCYFLHTCTCPLLQPSFSFPISSSMLFYKMRVGLLLHCLYMPSVHRLERKPIVLDSSGALTWEEPLISWQSWKSVSKDTLLAVSLCLQPTGSRFSCFRHSFHYLAFFSAWRANFSKEGVPGPASCEFQWRRSALCTLCLWDPSWDWNTCFLWACCFAPFCLPKWLSTLPWWWCLSSLLHLAYVHSPGRPGDGVSFLRCLLRSTNCLHSLGDLFLMFRLVSLWTGCLFHYFQYLDFGGSSEFVRVLQKTLSFLPSFILLDSSLFCSAKITDSPLDRPSPLSSSASFRRGRSIFLSESHKFFLPSWWFRLTWILDRDQTCPSTLSNSCHIFSMSEGNFILCFAEAWGRRWIMLGTVVVFRPCASWCFTCLLVRGSVLFRCIWKLLFVLCFIAYRISNN